MFKVIDELFDNFHFDAFCLTKLFKYSDRSLGPNNPVLIAKTPQNPITCEWLDRLKKYQENPPRSIEELGTKEDLARVKKYFSDPSIGPMKDLSPYLANLLLLKDLLDYDMPEQVEKG